MVSIVTQVSEERKSGAHDGVLLEGGWKVDGRPREIISSRPGRGSLVTVFEFFWNCEKAIVGVKSRN